MKLLRTAYRTRSLTECRSNFRMILARWGFYGSGADCQRRSNFLAEFVGSHEGEDLTLAGREKLGVFELILDRMRSGQVQQHGDALKRARHHASRSKISKPADLPPPLLTSLLP